MKSRPPVVYVMNKSAHDYTAAKSYGKLVYLTDKQVNRFATTNMHRHLIRALEHSDPEDYLLLTALTVLNVIAACIFAQKHKQLNLLIYQAKSNTYIARRLIF